MKKKLLTIMLAVIAALCFTVCFVACGEQNEPAPDATYTVTVEQSENGSVTASATTVKQGGSVTLTITPDSGYELDALTVNGSAVAVTGNTYTVTDVRANVTVGATFKLQAPAEQKVTVTFKNATPSSKQVTVGQAYGELPTVVGTPGNRFVGWFTAETGGTQVTAETIVTATADHTLYPHFTDKLIVTFDFGLGSGRELTREVSQDNAIGDLPDAQAPANSALLGWYVDDAAIDASYIVTGDVTVKASYITAVTALKADSAVSAIGGLTSGNTTPELEVTVTVDGEPSELAVTLETTDPAIATIAENRVTALADGSVQVKAMYNGAEVSRTEFYIVCRNYSEYTEVSDKAGLMAIASDVSGKYVLTADIDLAGGALWDGEWKPLFGAFTGVLDGMGHKVYNGIAHPSGWNQGAFMSVKGTVRDIAFTQLHTEANACYDNGFFGEVIGTVENVFLDLDYRHTALGGGTGYGVLAYAVGENGTLKNCVVNFHAGDVPLDYVGGFAVNAASWSGKVENCFTITNGSSLTSSLNGMYMKEGAAGVGAGITVNSAIYNYLAQLVNSQTVDVNKLGSAWSVKEGALYFYGNKVMDATPEYVINTMGDEEVVFEDLVAEDKAQRIYNISFIHNGEAMTGVPEGVQTESTDPTVAELIYDEDLGVFVLNSKKAGVTTITVSVGDYYESFTLTLTQIMHIQTAEEFKTKIAANPSGTFLLDNDIDFEGETLTAPIASAFTGSLDGQYHAVKNFKLASGANTGIFRYLRPNAVVKNIAFVNAQSADTDNCGGIFGEIWDGNVLVENVYIDYVVNANGSGETAGALTGKLYGATVKDVLVNIRFADGFDVKSFANVGAVCGQAKSYNVKASNMRVIVNGIPASAIAVAHSGDAATDTYFGDNMKFEGYGAFYASADGKATFTTDMGWKFENTGITFGTTKVLAVPEYTIIPEKSSMAVEFADGMEPFALNVTVLNYLETLTAYPDTMTVESSQGSVATVAINDGKITVTVLAVGDTVITVSVGDYSADIALKVALPAEADLVYTGATELSLDYETAGALKDIAITAEKDGAAADIPASVTLNSTNAAVASFVYNDETNLIQIRLDGTGTATLTAQIGAGTLVSVEVTVEQIFHIANADEFRNKLAADLTAHYVLDADIDLGGGWGGKTDGAAFGDFSGVLDGNGHKVSNFWLPGGWNGGGMFHNVTGTIKNIAFINAYGPGANVNCSGLFYELNGGAVIENVYLDYEVQGAALDANVGCGPLAYMWVAATVRNVIINLRFKDGLVPSELNYGSMAGKTAAWATHGYNNKVLINGATVSDMDLSFSDGASGDVLKQIKNEGSAQYGSYADLLASDLTAFTAENGWTIDATGITFGKNKVLEITA